MNLNSDVSGIIATYLVDHKTSHQRLHKYIYIFRKFDDMFSKAIIDVFLLKLMEHYGCSNFDDMLMKDTIGQKKYRFRESIALRSNEELMKWIKDFKCYRDFNLNIESGCKFEMNGLKSWNKRIVVLLALQNGYLWSTKEETFGFSEDDKDGFYDIVYPYGRESKYSKFLKHTGDDDGIFTESFLNKHSLLVPGYFKKVPYKFGEENKYTYIAMDSLALPEDKKLVRDTQKHKYKNFPIIWTGRKIRKKSSLYFKKIL